MIFNLDLEYGKFKSEKTSIMNFFETVSEFDPELAKYQEDLQLIAD